MDELRKGLTPKTIYSSNSQQSFENIKGLNERILTILTKQIKKERVIILKEIIDTVEKRWNEKTQENHKLVQNTIQDVEKLEKMERKNLENDVEQVDLKFNIKISCLFFIKIIDI